ENASVAFIITHVIKAGEEQRYEDWLSDILRAVSKSSGYLGREIFRPAHGSRKYTTIVRFDSHEHLNGWAGSAARRSYVDSVSDLLEEGDQHEIRTGIDFWFTPEGIKPPKRWKQFLLTLSAVYPLTLVLPLVLGPLFSRIPPPLNDQLIKGFTAAASLTALLTFVIMPHYTRLVKRWLYEESM
ncbi:MAG TPA: antibiotic biosynthesis monooxygenase, partial [Candidatus Binatus sp.]|nr:antibiotic biosynthesis monooxygenase [Candidatus Binatus sp.]